MIRSYLSDIKNDHKTQVECKIQLTMAISFTTQVECKIQLRMAISFTSFKDSNETRTMHTKSSNIEI